MTLTTNQNLILKKCRAELNLAAATLSSEYHYDSLPQCIIDAVYSISANYTSTRNTVIRYCERNNIQCLSNPLGYPSDAYTVAHLLSNIESYVNTDYGADALFGNKQRTSTQNGILKAKAVFCFANVLAENGIQTLAHIRSASNETIDLIEQQIKEIPGQTSGISFSYFLMLSGDDNHMKIDRWLLRFVGEALGEENYNNVRQAYIDLISVCEELKKIYPQLTPRLMDHVIWNHMRAKEKDV